MSNKRARKKQIQRAAPTLYPPGGGLMYVPAGQQQGPLGQVFYGNSLKNIPVGQTSLFSPGVPLPAQPDVDPQGKPVQWRFPVSYNTFPVDRSLGKPDIPSFEQLRRLAKMYSGITLNERYWLDMVPRMTLDIKIKKEYADQGAEAKNYQKELTYFKNFWEKPDGRHDTHTWLRMALREQTQIDELYLYKNRTRGRKLLGLWIVAGDQMKPLLDDWGMQPDAPDYAYQQYPWGIPGMMYSTDQMVHYQESPAADTPYGFSRVERFILEVNQALRKKRKDLANFTEGNIPQSFMEVPEGLNWTPDQIDAFEQSWNALLAGQVQQQVRIKFLQPGMKYTPAEQYQITFDPDLFLFKIACGCYGVPVTEFGFTEDSNRATGASQEDMVYRRTIEPNALTYAGIMTQSMAEDFPPELHGEMFEAEFGGFAEEDDENEEADILTKYTGAGILGLTDAAKIAKLPIDPKAPAIGRVIISPTAGPIFLDDVAAPEMRKAQADATMAGYQLAANPPEPTPDGSDTAEKSEQSGGGKSPVGQKPGSDTPMSRVVEALSGVEEQLRLLRARNVTPETRYADEIRLQIEAGETEEGGFDNVTRTQPNTEDEAGSDINLERATGYTPATGSGATDSATSVHGQDRTRAVAQEYRRWRDKAIKAVSSGKPASAPFVSDIIPRVEQAVLNVELRRCTTTDEVRAAFERVRGERDTSPKALAASNNGGNQQQNRSTWKLRW